MRAVSSARSMYRPIQYEGLGQAAQHGPACCCCCCCCCDPVVVGAGGRLGSGQERGDRGPGGSGLLGLVTGTGQHPRVLRPAALAGVHDEAALGQGDAGEPTGDDPHLLAVVHRERAQVDVAGAEVGAVVGGRGRQLHDLLRDPAAGIVDDGSPHVGELLVAGLRPDHEAVPAGAVDGLAHDAVEPVEHGVALVVVLEVVGRDVRQDRLLTEVVLDHLRHVRVDGLVVGDAVADRVREGDVAGPCRVEDAGHADEGVPPELQRVEEVVVDAAVDHVHPLQTLGGAHPDQTVAAQEVSALDQLDAHLAGQEGVLEVGRVVDAGGEHDHGGVVGARRGGGEQRVQEPGRVLGDRPHPLPGEELGQHVGHGPAVLDDVGDARRRAEVVLEHPEHAVLVADQVDAGHVDPHAVRRRGCRPRPAGSGWSS